MPPAFSRMTNTQTRIQSDEILTDPTQETGRIGVLPTGQLGRLFAQLYGSIYLT